MTNVAGTDATAISDELPLTKYVITDHTGCRLCTDDPEQAAELFAGLSATPSLEYKNRVSAVLARIAGESAPLPASGVTLDAYDAGAINDYGGGDVSWWQDYLRAELGHAHEFYEAQFASLPPSREDSVGVTDERVKLAIQAFDANTDAHDQWASPRPIRAALSVASLPPSRDDAVGVFDHRGTLARVVAILNEFGMPPEGEADQFEWLRERLSALEPAQQPIDRATVIEECARFIEAHQIAHTGSGDVIDPRQEGNRHGIAYADALRALSDKEPTNV